MADESKGGGNGRKTCPEGPVSFPPGSLQQEMDWRDPFFQKKSKNVATPFDIWHEGHIVVLGNCSEEEIAELLKCKGYTTQLPISLPGLVFLLIQVTPIEFIKNWFVPVVKEQLDRDEPESRVPDEVLQTFLRIAKPKDHPRILRRNHENKPFAAVITLMTVWELLDFIRRQEIDMICKSAGMGLVDDELLTCFDGWYPQQLMFSKQGVIVCIGNLVDLSCKEMKLLVTDQVISVPVCVGMQAEGTAQVTIDGHCTRIGERPKKFDAFQLAHPKTDEQKLLVFQLCLACTLEPMLGPLGWE